LLVGLIPVAAVALPGGLEDLAFWVQDIGTEGATAGEFVELAQKPGSISFQDLRGWERRGDGWVPPGQSKRSSDVTTSSSTATTATTDQPTTTAPDPSTTITSATTTSTSSTKQSDGTITGDACPCNVTGIVELEGEIRLHGDLIVNGGTLVARGGVDLEGNGHEIVFISGGRADFQGTPVFTWSGDGSNANLERDINFRNLRRIIHTNNAGASIMKFFTVSDSGTPTLGDYPLHWHLNGDSTRGTIVEGVVVVNGAHHAFVPHGSHGITFKDVIAKNIRDDAFWWDSPGTNDCSTHNKFCTMDNSNDILVIHALVDGVYELSSNSASFHRVTGFVLGAGSGNLIRDSLVRDIKGGQNCSGFHWPGGANQNVGGNVWTAQNLRTIDDDCHGIAVWQNDGNQHIIDGFVGGGIDHGAYVNHYDYRNVDVPYLRVHALGWSISASSVGDVRVRRHSLPGGPVTFTNVQIASCTIGNVNASAQNPGTYILNNTNMSCADIVYDSVVPGTRVIIDGKEC